MLKTFAIAAAFIVVGGIMMLANAYWYSIGDIIYRDRNRITANITVDNRCDFANFALIVRDVTSGRYTQLNGNTAKIRTIQRNRLRIELAPQFRKVRFKMPVTPAKEEMTLVADCKTRNFKDYFGDSADKARALTY
ncbi:MAG: hypothetical protein JXR13_08820 [Thalassovita sp.]